MKYNKERVASERSPYGGTEYGINSAPKPRITQASYGLQILLNPTYLVIGGRGLGDVKNKVFLATLNYLQNHESNADSPSPFGEDF